MNLLAERKCGVSVLINLHQHHQTLHTSTPSPPPPSQPYHWHHNESVVEVFEGLPGDDSWNDFIATCGE